ncbi:MAG TPA: sugar phosphorylase [Beijerinckiaceae bacterium]|jgi:hypothetical protein
MRLKELLKALEGLDPETLVCVAEVDEAFGAEIAEVEIVDDARRDPEAADQEAVEFGAGDQRAVVLRW